jgi:hypothetical protein
MMPRLGGGILRVNQRRSFLVLRLARDDVGKRPVKAELAGRAARQRRVKGVVPDRLAGFGDIVFQLGAGSQINRGAVMGQWRQMPAMDRAAAGGRNAGFAKRFPDAGKINASGGSPWR